MASFFSGAMGLIGSLFGGDDDDNSYEAPPAENPYERAEVPDELAANKKKKKLAGSLLTQDWAAPTLGSSGLLGR